MANRYKLVFFLITGKHVISQILTLMKKIIYIALFSLLVGSLSSCSDRLCPAYGSYPKSGR